MRTRWIIFGAVTLTLVLVAIIFLTRTPVLKLNNVGPMGMNIQYPWLKDQTTVDYFTGEAFAEYSLTDGKTKLISKQLLLPDIIAMRWSPTGVMFEAGGYSPADNLYGQLRLDSRDTEQAYWWLYDFSSGKLEPMYGVLGGNNPTNVAWGKDGKSILFTSTQRDSATTENTSVTGVDDNEYDPSLTGLYRSVGGKISQIVPNSNKVGDIIGEDNQNIYYGRTDNLDLNKVALSSKKISTIEKDYSGNGLLSPNSQYIAYTSSDKKQPKKSPGDAPKAKLRIVNTVDGKNRYSDNGFNGIYSFQADSTLLTSYQDNQTTMFSKADPANGKNLIYKLAQKINGVPSALLPINPSDDYFALSNTDNNLLLYARSPLPIIYSPNNQYKIQTDAYDADGYTINYLADSSQYNIYIKKNPYTEYQNKALQYIRDKGVDPNQIMIKWYAYDGVNSLQ